MLNILIQILLLIVGLFLGFYLLLLGRRALAVTTAIICLAFMGQMLAVIFLGQDTVRALAEQQAWILLAVTLAAGIIGGILGSRAKSIAANIIGFVAGGYIALWFYDIAFYLMVSLADWPQQTAFLVGVILLIIGGLVGLILTRRDEGVAVILVSVFVGAHLIVTMLGLSSDSSFRAVISISLALLGLVVQYAQYLREIQVERPLFTTHVADRPAPELFDLSDER